MKEKKSSFRELIAVTRGEIVENLHFGSYCIFEKTDGIIYSYGDINNLIYTRSTAKPFQALAVILSGAYEKYNISSKELALICSSHFAEKQHIETVLSLLSKIGLNEKDLLTPLTYSRLSKVKENQLLLGEKPSKLNSDCSGKHAGMLSVCKTKGYPIENYVDINHPLQKEILKIVSIIYSYEDIKVGIDGCSAPVFAVPLESIAKSYLTLITCKLDNKQKEIAKKYNYSVEKVEDALKIVKNSILQNPQMIAGTEGLCTLLISLYGGSCIAKVGAAGVYCLGLNDFNTKKDLGIALKISDGSIAAAEFALMSILYRLNILPSTRSNYIDAFLFKKNLNEHGNPIGEYLFLDQNLAPLSSLI
jgi:L-asparaginase II